MKATNGTEWLKGLIFGACMVLSLAVFSAPLSGIYTIGGSSPSYATFTAAVSDLIANGVSGPVRFKVRSGTYNEQISITAITGASAMNTITIESESGNRADVTLQFSNTSTENYVIELNGASYITIQNMTLASIEPTLEFGQIIVFTNQCDYDKILNNTLNGLPVTSWYTSANVISAYCPSTGLVVEGNTINYGTQSMIWLGTDNTPGGLMNCSVVKNNIMSNAHMWSMAIGYQNNSVLEGNTFTSNSTNLNLGMQIQDVVNPLSIINNKFTYDNTFCVLYIVNNHPPDLAHGVTVANNFFNLGGNCSAMCLINNDYSKIYHNSVYSMGAGQGFINYGNSHGTVLANNIFYEATGAPTMNIAAGSISSSDYNVLYTTGSTLVQWNNVNQPNLAAWQSVSGFDTHSLSVVPPFTSFADLHLTNYSPMQFGTSISEVPADIDYRLRSVVPAVGADDNGTILYTVNANSCGGVVNPQPEFIADKTVVCAGAAVQFTDQSGNNPTGWEWTFTGGTPSTSASPNATVTYHTPGNYDVKLVISFPGGKDSLTKTSYITVNPNALAGTISALQDTICSGATASLNVSGSFGSIQWQSSITPSDFDDISAANGVTYLDTPSQTTYYRIVASTGTCNDTSLPFVVIVNPLPASPALTTADTLICSGDSTNICTSGPYHYLWNTGATSSCIQVGDAGGYWLTVTDTNGCSAISNRQNISVYPSPSVSIVIQGDTLSSFGAVSYQWYFNGEIIPGANGPIHIAQQTGEYSLEITDANDCRARSNEFSVVRTGIVSAKLSGFSVYPNPFQSFVLIQSKDVESSIESIDIYDIVGRLIYRNTNTTSALTTKIDASEFASGGYSLIIRTSEVEYRCHIIK